ncbi:MAG: glucosamine-6-phosphate deaminase [Clostridiales bacterium]|nr:glucosamine-6-phosphate deaminase [Clostridiales bacterium]
MNVIITENYEEMSKKAAEILIGIVKSNPNAILGLATGSSPIGTYKNMIKDHKENGTSYKNVKTVNLDEYVGLTKDHDQSYAYFMRTNLFDYIDIDQNNTNLPCGSAPDTQKECDRYNALLETMKQDVQVLGLGSNGHIGFNEPNTPFESVTHLVDLTENTIKDNSRLFASIDEVPRQALSMGIKNIMQAKSILMVVSGKNKAEAVKGMVKGEVTPALPASVLQLHPYVTIVCDKDAASLL